MAKHLKWEHKNLKWVQKRAVWIRLAWSDYVHSLSFDLQARRAKTSFFFASICRANTDPPRSRKSGYGLLLGCRSGLDEGPFKKTFLTMLKTIGQKTKTGNSSPSVRILYCNRSGVWSNESGGSPWCSRKSRTARQNRANFFAGKKQKRNFGLKFSTFFAGSFVVIRESRELEIESDRRDRFSDKNSQKRRIFFSYLRLFSKVGAHPLLKFSLFRPRKN